MQSRNIELINQIQNLESKLKTFPPGTLICTRNGKHFKWYQSTKHKIQYIPKSNLTLAKQLAMKKYLAFQLEELIQEQHAIEQYLNSLPKVSKSSQLLLNPKFHSLLSNQFIPISQELYEWSTSSYERNLNHPENLLHKGSSGIYLRSKSETIIEMLLHTNHIPFRYECLLQLGDMNVYPDFTIRHPRTGTLFYWEHFGLMDNPGYIHNTFSKLNLYTSHGIIPSINLITTYETKTHPIDIDTIRRIIQFYFL